MNRMTRFGFWRAIPAALAALALALLLTHAASAATKVKGTVRVSAQEYANICDDYGASDISVGTNSQGHTTVSCGWSDGTSSVCDFKTNTCVDTIPMTTSDPRHDFRAAINQANALPVSVATATPAPVRIAIGAVGAAITQRP